MTRADVDAVLPYLSDRPRSIVLSSMDVYSAYELAVSGRTGVAVPFDEDCPLRERRYPHRGERVDIDGYDHVDMDSYDKLVVESRCRSRAATVLRLGMVYGEDDPQRREEFVLRRVRAGRTVSRSVGGVGVGHACTPMMSPVRSWRPWTLPQRRGRCSTSVRP